MTTSSVMDTFKTLGLSTVDSVSTKTTPKQNLGQEQFLKLLTTQLTHQDPMKPMESGDFLGQMAQFSTVSGIQDLQASFKSFADSINSGQALQAATLVGHHVSVPSDKVQFSGLDGEKIYGDFDLPSSSDNIRVKIIDPSSGEVVSDIDLGTRKAGKVEFDWDGIDSNGAMSKYGVYKVEASAMIDGKNTVLATNVRAKVESVTMASGGGGLQVNLFGLEPVKFSEIKQIL